MSYREKMLKKRLFCTSLAILNNFAYQEPKLSLESRRSVVAAIYLGGRTGCSTAFKLVPELAQKSHQYTQDGLTKAFSEKLNPPNKVLADAIMKVSSLSAWAFANPNHCESITELFACNMVPEDTSDNTLSPINTIISELRSNWGKEKTLDLITLSIEFWNKKYPQDR